MSWPSPTPGLVIRYAYLWRREALTGSEEGAKDRPCAIVAAIKRENDETTVYVLPITHSPPGRDEDALELPQPTKIRLGLDSDRSWIVLSEANAFIWPGPDLRFVAGRGPESIAYGMLPPGLMRIVKERFAQLLKARRAVATSRTV